MGKVGRIRMLSWWGLWTSDSSQVLGSGQAMTSEGRRRARAEKDAKDVRVIIAKISCFTFLHGTI